MDNELVKIMKELDQSLTNLGLSDSTVEYAQHVRQEFNNVVDDLNKLKEYLGFEPIEDDLYFYDE